MKYLKTVEEFELYKNKFTVFIFSGKWCSDCRVIEPIIPQIEKEFPNMNFVYVDRDQFIDLCFKNNILGIPSFIVYENNELKGTFISKYRKTKTEIIEFLNSIK